MSPEASAASAAASLCVGEGRSPAKASAPVPPPLKRPAPAAAAPPPVLPPMWLTSTGWRTPDGEVVPWLAPAAVAWQLSPPTTRQPEAAEFLLPPPPPHAVLRPLPFLEAVDWRRSCGGSAPGDTTAIMAVGHAATLATVTAAAGAEAVHVQDASSSRLADAFTVPPLLTELPAVVVQVRVAAAPTLACRLAGTPGIHVLVRHPGFVVRVVTARLRAPSLDAAAQACAAIVGRGAAGAATVYQAKPSALESWDAVAAAVAQRPLAKPLEAPPFPPKPSRAVLATGGALFYWAVLHPDPETLPAPRALLFRALEDLTLRHGVVWRVHRPMARRQAPKPLKPPLGAGLSQCHA